MKTADKNEETSQMWALTAHCNKGLHHSHGWQLSRKLHFCCSPQAEDKAAAGGENHSGCGSPLPWYLSTSFRGYWIYTYLELLRKNPVPQLRPTLVTLNHLLLNLAPVTKKAVILCSTREEQCFGFVTDASLKDTFAHLVYWNVAVW